MLKKSKKAESKSIGENVLWYFAVLVTGIWFLYASALTIPQVYSCSESWDVWVPFVERFSLGLNATETTRLSGCLTLNEFGDFLAGTFAPLAFLWIVVAVILQSAELKEQRLALEAQLEESRRLVEMQAAELILSRARTTRDKFEAFLGMIRPACEHISKGHGVGDDPIAYFSKYGPEVCY